ARSPSLNPLAGIRPLAAGATTSGTTPTSPPTFGTNPPTSGGGMMGLYPERSQLTVTNSLIESSNSVIAGFRPMSVSPIASGFLGGPDVDVGAATTGGALAGLSTTGGLGGAGNGRAVRSMPPSPPRPEPTARVVRLRDVARVELGAKSQDVSSK